MRAERNASIASVRAAWCALYRFWYGEFPLRVKTMMFKCLVYEAAVSWWTAASPSKAAAALDSIVLRSARLFFRGRALRQKHS